jgi:hypothetical protein
MPSLDQPPIREHVCAAKTIPPENGHANRGLAAMGRTNPLRLLRNGDVIGLGQVGLDLAFHFALSGIIVVGIGLRSTAVRAIQTGVSVRTSFPKERFTVSDRFQCFRESEKLVVSSF